MKTPNPALVAKLIEIYCRLLFVKKTPPDKDDLKQIEQIFKDLSSDECRDERPAAPSTVDGFITLVQQGNPISLCDILKNFHAGNKLSPEERAHVQQTIEKTILSSETCQKCRWFIVHDDLRETPGVFFGWCHKNAPTPYLRQNDEGDCHGVTAEWPFVNSDDFCGNFETKKP